MFFNLLRFNNYEDCIFKNILRILKLAKINEQLIIKKIIHENYLRLTTTYVAVILD